MGIGSGIDEEDNGLGNVSSRQIERSLRGGQKNGGKGKFLGLFGKSEDNQAQQVAEQIRDADESLLFSPREMVQQAFSEFEWRASQGPAYAAGDVFRNAAVRSLGDKEAMREEAENLSGMFGIKVDDALSRIQGASIRLQQLGEARALFRQR